MLNGLQLFIPFVVLLLLFQLQFVQLHLLLQHLCFLTMPQFLFHQSSFVFFFHQLRQQVVVGRIVVVLR